MLEYLHPAYAETHYKFRLPWSPLHRPLPEMLIDAPFQVIPGQSLMAWLVVRDADLYPVRIEEVRLIANFSQQPPQEFVFPLDRHLDQAFHFIPLDLSGLQNKGLCHLHTRLRGANARGRSWEFWNNNLPGLSAHPLEVHFLEYPLPMDPGWSAGETHCHTWHSSDPVEFGGQPTVMQQAARICGLDFVLCTDHSYDFAYRTDDYRQIADPQERWASYRKELAELPLHPLMIPGEEVSCGSANGKNLHLLVPGHPDFLPGEGDGGRRWFRNRPDLSVAQVLQRVGSLPCFAAHPKVPLGWLESRIFRRGPWSENDLHLDSPHPVRGLQFWNGTREDWGYRRGRAWWVSLLLRGHRLVPLAGNDAHGDLNQCTGVAIPLLKLKAHRRHVLGKARTVVRAEPRLESIQNALARGDLYCTDGPLLHFEEGDSLRLLARSTPDQGGLREIRIFRGTIGEQEERVEQQQLGGTLQNGFTLDQPGPRSYVRAECTTAKGQAALTAAIFG